MTKYFYKKIQKKFSEENVRISNVGYSRNNSAGFVNAWKIYPAKNRPKAKIIFVHATGNDALFPQVSLFLSLVKHGFEVFSFDLDGHGSQSSTIFDSSEIKKCLNQALSSLCNENDSPIFIIGQSLGGALIMNYISEQNQSHLIKGIIIVSTPIEVKLKSIDSIKELLGFVHISFLNQIKYYGLLGSLPAIGNFKRKDFPIRLQKGKNQLDYQKLIAKLIKNLDLKNLATKIKIPSLLIYGSLDTIAPIEDGEELHRILSDSEFYISKNETHFTTLLEYKVEDKIISWMDKLL